MCTSRVFTFGLLMSLFMILTAPFANSDIVSHPAMAQGYDNNNYNNYYGDNDMYSKYPTEVNKYECRTGQFEGFFVSSVEFCLAHSFEDHNKDRHREKPPPPVETETLTVIKNTQCQADPAICEQNPIHPSNFTVVLDGNNPSQNNFPGSSSPGTNVELEPGAYNVTEQGVDPVIPVICSTMGFKAGSDLGDNLLICTNFSDECEGDITIGDPQTCTIENVLVEQNFLDLAVTNFGSNNVSILLGNGTGSFGTATNFTAGTEPISVAVGDFNGDTILDLAVVNGGSNNVSILLGTGTGSLFGITTNFGVGTAPVSVAVGDFNADTILDLAVANFGSSNVPSNISILLGTGTSSLFGTATNFGVGISPRSVAVGDFNGDTVLDLAVANQLSNNVSILLGTGTGSLFGTATNFEVGIGPRFVAVGDFNGDTILDLAVTNVISNNISILLGTGTGSLFGTATNFEVGTQPASFAIGDFN